MREQIYDILKTALAKHCTNQSERSMFGRVLTDSTTSIFQLTVYNIIFCRDNHSNQDCPDVPTAYIFLITIHWKLIRTLIETLSDHCMFGHLAAIELVERFGPARLT